MPPGGIRTHNISRGATADLRIRPRGYWDRQIVSLSYKILELIYVTCIRSLLFTIIKQQYTIIIVIIIIIIIILVPYWKIFILFLSTFHYQESIDHCINLKSVNFHQNYV
jgi:hypothetical protein